ncbi:hypothetical protein KY290_026125 [Solanum tuberosum]|uniref:Retrotransposon gag domain-containing protein n=1 Tax=Solanum tuberosum TaxID=4113 RepID=A0ABQ7UVJ6_SOLTU|nr:hypothetical protein KY284_024978 [Solanum tuberosum]KAH0755855.1 hypothetical protein KY290_026125 [Solanum tuberosum]
MHNGVRPTALSERFEEGFEDPMEELKNLQQTSTVKEYQTEFNRLLTGNPRTLMQAYKIARFQEGVFEAQALSWGLKTNNKSQHSILSTPTTFKPQTFQKPFISNPTFMKPFEPNGSRVNRFNGNNPGRRLTAAEMDEKRAKGLCFSCDKKYVVGHICKAKKQIFLVDVIEDEAESELVELEQEVREETNEFMTISLQAFTGLTGYQTIRGKKHVLRGASSQLKATKATKARALNKKG